MRTLMVAPLYNVITSHAGMKGYPAGYQGAGGRFQTAPPGTQHTFQGSGVRPGPATGTVAPQTQEQTQQSPTDASGQMNFQQVENSNRIKNMFSKGTFNPDGSLSFNNKTIPAEQVQFFRKLLQQTDPEAGIQGPWGQAPVEQTEQPSQPQIVSMQQQLQQLTQQRDQISARIQQLQSQMPQQTPKQPAGRESGQQVGEFMKTPWRAVKDVARNVGDWTRNFGRGFAAAEGEQPILTANMGSASGVFD